VLDVIAPVLRERFTVFVARGVRHAVAVASELKGSPDAIVIDFTASTVRGGARLARLLNWRRARRIPIVALCDDSDAARVRRAVRVDALLRLPVDPDELATRIGALVDEQNDRE
jgi:PleD family two-component response regulator